MAKKKPRSTQAHREPPPPRDATATPSTPSAPSSASSAAVSPAAPTSAQPAAPKRRRWLRRLAVWTLSFVVGFGLVAGALAIWTFWISDDLVFRYTVTVRAPRSGRIHVRAEISNHSKPLLRLRRQAGPEHMRIFNFRATTADGKLLTDRWHGPTRVIYTGFRDKVFLDYEIKPGGMGRHGHQGMLQEAGGIVAGRVLFFLPRDDKDLRDYLVRFQTPASWSAVSPWEPRAGETKPEATEPTLVSTQWLDPKLEGAPLAHSLDSSTLGFGRWYSQRRNIGGTRFEVHVSDAFPPAVKQRVAGRAVRIFEVLQALFRFQFPSKFVTAFVPRGPDGKGIIAGYWSNGMGNEMDDSDRTWALYAHRILHVINRDHPYGMHLAQHPDYLRWDNPVNWINEGMASFFEVWATLKAGVVTSDYRNNALWEDYIKKHTEGSKFLVPLAREHLNRDEDVTEYLHYYKAPLFTQNLDWWLRKQSGGQKDLAGFISSVYPRYEKHKAAMDFYGELEKYAGQTLKWFWDKYAVADDILLPLWDDVFQKYGQGQERVIGQVNGQPLLADAAYQRVASNMQAASAARRRLVREKLLELELRKRKPGALPEEVWRVFPHVPAHWRAFLVRKVREELSYALYGKKGTESERRLDEHIDGLVKVAVVSP